MKQRARRLVISRAIERKPRPHTGASWWKGTHRYRGPGTLLTGEIGQFIECRFIESTRLDFVLA